jgi:hypothetical protein
MAAAVLDYAMLGLEAVVWELWEVQCRNDQVAGAP